MEHPVVRLKYIDKMSKNAINGQKIWFKKYEDDTGWNERFEQIDENGKLNVFATESMKELLFTYDIKQWDIKDISTKTSRSGLHLVRMNPKSEETNIQIAFESEQQRTKFMEQIYPFLSNDVVKVDEVKKNGNIAKSEYVVSGDDVVKDYTPNMEIFENLDDDAKRMERMTAALKYYQASVLSPSAMMVQTQDAQKLFTEFCEKHYPKRIFLEDYIHFISVITNKEPIQNPTESDEENEEDNDHEDSDTTTLGDYEESDDYDEWGDKIKSDEGTDDDDKQKLKIPAADTMEMEQDSDDGTNDEVDSDDNDVSDDDSNGNVVVPATDTMDMKQDSVPKQPVDSEQIRKELQFTPNTRILSDLLTRHYATRQAGDASWSWFGEKMDSLYFYLYHLADVGLSVEPQRLSDHKLFIFGFIRKCLQHPDKLVAEDVVNLCIIFCGELEWNAVENSRYNYGTQRLANHVNSRRDVFRAERLELRGSHLMGARVTENRPGLFSL